VTIGYPGDQSHERVIVNPGLEELGMGGEGCDLAEGGSFQLGGQILMELSDNSTPLFLQPGLCELPFLDHQAQPKAQEGDARQEDRREEEEDLSPVRMGSHGPEPPFLESSPI
jgi:hypothetical protein